MSKTASYSHDLIVSLIEASHQTIQRAVHSHYSFLVSPLQGDIIG